MCCWAIGQPRRWFIEMSSRANAPRRSAFRRCAGAILIPALTAIAGTQIVTAMIDRETASGERSLVACGFAAGKRQPVPQVVLATDQWDCGAVSAGTTVQATFSVRNAGSHRLILVGEQRSCECVAGRQPNVVVEPGQTAQLVVTLDTAGLLGPVRREIEYRTNDPERPLVRLTVLANVAQ